jgi:hypothetical protein
MTGRTRLPNRRLAETHEIAVGGLHYVCTIGRSSDGSILEVFIGNHKTGNAADVAARDAGILISLLLQHDCPPETIARAITRNVDGSAGSIVGAAIDLVIAETAR